MCLLYYLDNCCCLDFNLLPCFKCFVCLCLFQHRHCFLVGWCTNKSYVIATSDLWLFNHASNLLPSTHHPTPLHYYSRKQQTARPHSVYWWLSHQRPVRVGLHCQARCDHHPWRHCSLYSLNLQLDDGGGSSHQWQAWELIWRKNSEI